MSEIDDGTRLRSYQGNRIHHKSARTTTAALTFLKGAAEKSAIMLLIISVWEALPRLGLVDPFLLPPFSEAVISLLRLFQSGEMFRHITISLGRSGLAFIAAVAFSIPVGTFMGWNKRIERIVDPLLQVCRNTSTLALYPVFILFFGLGETSKVAIILWGTVWPILLNTISGVKEADPLLIKSARSMGISRTGLFLRVVWPMALPSILTGLRLSAATSILMLVAAEMLGADKGLGFMIFYYQERYAIPEMFGGIIFISVLGVLINYCLVRLESRMTRWKERTVKG
ncbi:NitT/TauT family transport system permease protein [Paenibacillus sophorae]|uniref:ABC transporter permease n=1 Tax=Paenibacillus sophorae TaxID=1333845 RepID=A0A1H8K522_9BACL|nr:ABC transporter permease [Paenibacillus sophorae]QWU13593.1 ABC transporter permease [Paenibacillus sophorae]SEN87508.1 NitT/TauT family transport system permease protein [Paenibacillus sophorae]